MNKPIAIRLSLAAGLAAPAAADACWADVPLEIIAGKALGRPSAKAVTLCDLTGTGVQDTAIATLARSRAEARGPGTLVQS